MLYNRRYDRLLIVLVPAALFVYASFRPHVRLRASMPPQFVDVQPNARPAQRAAEEHLAQAYWKCVLTEIQWKYTYGSLLPETPPEEFRPSLQLAPGSEPVASSRVRYWRRLQQVWLQPSSWVTSREWSTAWLTQPIINGKNWFEKSFRELLERG